MRMQRPTLQCLQPHLPMRHGPAAAPMRRTSAAGGAAGGLQGHTHRTTSVHMKRIWQSWPMRCRLEKKRKRKKEKHHKERKKPKTDAEKVLNAHQ